MSLLLAGALCLVLIEAPLPAAGDTTPEPSGDVKTLAVMYFENRSVGSEWQWLSTGIADMLIVDLGRSERLLVVERERLARMLTELRLVEGGLIDPANAAKVGQVTKVDWVLFGSFEKKGDSLNIEGHIL
jgi:TolB-like protein